MRIAMWSGPRNLSTAMMYSFGARDDCAVVDEPFYGAYLDLTKVEHPLGNEITSQMETDPNRVVSQLLGTIPAQKERFYQKHMCQHMVEGVDRAWMNDCTNVFLIRHPARVVASYAAKRENPSLEDIGFIQQAELFDQVKASGQTPIVIDSFDIRQNPSLMMELLCDALGIPFQKKMLIWPEGGHSEDGVWASHWYGAVHRSTGFAGAEGSLPNVEGDLARVVEQALPSYQKLAEQKLCLA